MFGVSRCSCGSLVTGSDLRCVGCGRVLKDAVSEPLKCDECGEVLRTNPACERCFPKPASVAEAHVVASLPPSLISDDNIPIFRARPIVIGGVCCLATLLVGYLWGRSDQRARDHVVLEQVRVGLMEAAERERTELEEKLTRMREESQQLLIGPLRIHWGQAPDASTIGPSNHLSLVSTATASEGGKTSQTFTGAFGDSPSSEISVIYCQQRLSRVEVALPSVSTPVYETWRAALERSRTSFGEPSILNRPPSAEAFEVEFAARLQTGNANGSADAGPSLLEAKSAAVQLDVASGAAPLFAEWDLAQRTTMKLSADVARGDGESDDRSVLRWAFVKADLEEPCSQPEADAGAP